MTSFEQEVEADLEVDVEEDKSRSPLMQAAQSKFLLLLSDEYVPTAEKLAVKEALVALIRDKKMLGFYQLCCKELSWIEDENLVADLSKSNADEIVAFDAKLEDATKNQGETEIREILTAKAQFISLSGEKDDAIAAWKTAGDKTVGSGMKIDVCLALVKLGFLWSDAALVTANITEAKRLVERGGDWERRNLLAVYEACFGFQTRDFKTASTKLIDSVATFTCYELFDYNSFIMYTVVAALVAVGRDRVLLRDKIVKEPEILTVIHEIPNLKETLFSLYQCNYSEFFPSLLALSRQIKRDMFLSPHLAYILREVRLVVYSQFLASYKGVSLDSMAKSFGVTSSFLDRELSRFISAGRLNCKIDKVSGVVETVQKDSKNDQYASFSRQGDLLLNRVQKLTKLMSN